MKLELYKRDEFQRIQMRYERVLVFLRGAEQAVLNRGFSTEQRKQAILKEWLNVMELTKNYRDPQLHSAAMKTLGEAFLELRDV